MAMEKAAETVVAPRKKRKLEVEESEGVSASSVQVKTRRFADVTAVTLGSSICESAAGSDGDLASCCSSNGSSEPSKEDNQVTVDQFLATTNGHALECIERTETTLSSELESTAVDKMPSDDDLEEFFASAEKNLQKQFVDKYNYDIVKDEPLDGRFEWVQIKEN